MTEETKPPFNPPTGETGGNKPPIGETPGGYQTPVVPTDLPNTPPFCDGSIESTPDLTGSDDSGDSGDQFHISDDPLLFDF